MIVPSIKWYKTTKVHPGHQRSKMMIHTSFYYSDIEKAADNFHCDYCQHVKIP